MGLIVKFEVSCNQCWKTIIFTTTGNFIDSIGMAIPEGWGEPYPTDDDYLLCPDCLKDHEKYFPIIKK